MGICEILCAFKVVMSRFEASIKLSLVETGFVVT